jgi:hypothetical protein
MSGYLLVATARDTGRLDDLVKNQGHQVRTTPLDVADGKAAYAAVRWLKRSGFSMFLRITRDTATGDGR